MSDAEILGIITDALWVAAQVGGPMLLVAMAIGVMVSLFQAVTQVQEMSLTFVPKLIGVAAVLVFAGNWMLAQLVTWVDGLWSAIPTMVT